MSDAPPPGAWKALLVGELPVLLIRDREGVLRAFLDVCRHSGAALSCPYHAWLYRLDGSLARAQGVGNPEGFDVADYSLKLVLVSVFRRGMWIHADQTAVERRTSGRSAIGPTHTVVHRRLYARPGAGADSVLSNVAAHRLAHLQDVDICQAVQRSHNAGLSAGGVLATTEEQGVFWVHQHVRSACGD